MPLNALAQDVRAKLGWVYPRHLVEIQLATDTLKLSTCDFAYKYTGGQVDYMGLVVGINGLGETVDLDQPMNSSVSLKLLNAPWGRYQYLTQLDREQPFIRATVAIYEVRLVEEGEVFADLNAGRTLLGKWAVDQIRDVDTRARTLSISCCSRTFARRNNVGLKRVTAKDFPLADRNDLGKFRNLPFGDLEYVPCRLLKTGAVDTLFADVGSGSISSLVVSGVAKIAWAVSGTLQCGDEQFTYSAYNAGTKTFTGVSRARNGTKAVPHTKGASVYQVITEAVYEASALPVDAITDVFVDNVRQPIGSVCQVYTGKSGSQLSGWGETAVIRFPVKPVVKKQVNLEVETEHTHTTSEGTHGHTYSGASNIVKAFTGYSMGQNCSNGAYAIDGDENTSAYLSVNSSSSSGEADLFLNPQSSGNLGTILGVTVKVLFSFSLLESLGNSLNIYLGQEQIATWQKVGSLGKGWRTYYASGSVGWNPTLRFELNASPLHGGSVYVYDAFVEFSCTPTIAKGPAAGVETQAAGSTTLGGESVADVIIGQEVSVHMRGVFDDSAGTCTGTPGALVEQCPDVFKYILVKLQGIPAADLGASFAATRTALGAIGYKFAFLMHDLGSDGQRILSALAGQCRSLFYEWAGRFELRFLPTFAPDPDFVVDVGTDDGGDVVAGPVFNHAPLGDVATLTMGFFRKDYRGNKDPGVVQNPGINADALAAGYLGYVDDGWGARDIEETLQFNAIRVETAAQDLVKFNITRKRTPPIEVELSLRWRAILAAPGMAFALNDPAYGDQVFSLLRYMVNHDAGTIDVAGLLLPKWYFDDSYSTGVADETLIIQTQVMSINDAVSESLADQLGGLIVVAINDAGTDSFAEEPVLVQSQALGILDSVTETVDDTLSLGVAWARDPGGDIMPSTDSAGTTGWFEDDPTDLEPRTALGGVDIFWEMDPNSDLMPI